MNNVQGTLSSILTSTYRIGATACNAGFTGVQWTAHHVLNLSGAIGSMLHRVGEKVAALSLRILSIGLDLTKTILGKGLNGLVYLKGAAVAHPIVSLTLAIALLGIGYAGYERHMSYYR